MHKSSSVEMSGYTETGRLEFSKELVYVLIGIWILGLFAFGFIFLYLYSLFTGKEGGEFNITPSSMILAISLFASTCILHELIHDFFFSLYGGKPRYGGGTYFILPYLYTTTKTIFPRNRLIIICIAPLLVISIIGIFLMAAFPVIAHWILVPLVVNASG
ncbi:MAG TPA: DUF3267 domain-containing protein [Candidatus Methanoperedens sp.]